MKRFVKYISTIIAILVIPTITFASSSNTIGTSSDPYVTKSYVDVQISAKSKEIQDLKNQISELKNEIKSLQTAISTGSKTITPPTPTTTTKATTTTKGYINGSYVNVRSAASTSSSIVTTLSKNTAVDIIKKVTSGGKQWYNVKLANGKTGYVSAPYIRQ